MFQTVNETLTKIELMVNLLRKSFILWEKSVDAAV